MTVWENYDGRRLDLLHPLFWVDGDPKYNVLIIPDHLSFPNYMDLVQSKVCMANNKTPWEEKAERVWFRGKITGETYDEDGNFINRLKLLWIAEEYPDLFNVTLWTLKD